MNIVMKKIAIHSVLAPAVSVLPNHVYKNGSNAEWNNVIWHLMPQASLFGSDAQLILAGSDQRIK